MAVPKGRGYDSVFFESSLAWTQANLARRRVGLIETVFPVGMWPIRPSPGTKPVGPPMKAADSATVGKLCMVSDRTVKLSHHDVT